MPYNPIPQIINYGTGTGNIQQVRRKKDLGRSKQTKRSYKKRFKARNTLRAVGALS